MDKNYQTIDLLANGKYSSTLGVEFAQLEDGFAYLEPFVLSQEHSLKNYLKIRQIWLEYKIGALFNQFP